MNYKHCARCRFRVPDTRRHCQVCGNNNWLVPVTRNYETVSFGSTDPKAFQKFKRIFADLPFLSGNLSQAKQSGQSPPSLSDAIESAQEWSASAQAEAIYAQNLGGSEEEISQLKQNIEELASWFRNYGSDGLLTNRG